MDLILRHVLLALLVVSTTFCSGQESEEFTVIVNLYKPVSDQENQLLEEILLTQIKYFVENSAEWKGDKISFKDSPKKTVSKLNDLVKDDVKFHDYEALGDFKGFSDIVTKKLENITDRTYDISTSDGISEQRSAEIQMEHQLSELLSIIRTEILVYGEKNITESVTEVYSGLTQKERDALINEIDSIKDGDMLESINISYEEMTIEDTSGAFIGDPREEDLADKILNLLAENSQRLERLESELSQLYIDGSSSVSQNPLVSSNDMQIFNKLPESMNFYFYSGSSKLTTAALLQLNEIVELLAMAEGVKVVITGFADKSGSVGNNLVLSKKRAQAVKKFMKDSGMKEDRFIINYYGESKSDGYSNEERRVEIKFFM